MFKEKNHKLYICSIVLLVMLVQFVDSYCAELYSKMQSFVVRDYIIKGTELNMNEAVSKLGYMMLPFYIIPALSPMVIIFVDKYGKKKVILINGIVLILGCLMCGKALNIGLFLIGNGLITLATSTDIQNIYIVQELPKNKRATIRGVMSGVTACAAMLIPLIRKINIESGQDWRGVYFIAVLLGVAGLGVILITKEKSLYKNETEHIETNNKENKNIVKNYMIILFFVGIATSGVTMYNEPILVNRGCDEALINTVLLIQPITLLVVNIISGYFADKSKRNIIVLIDITLSVVSLVVYILSSDYMIDSYILGIAWGVMVGCYFSAVNIMFIIIMENVKYENIGKISALSAYVNGAGNACGIIMCTTLVKEIGMEIVKLTTAIPVLLISVVLIVMFTRLKAS